MKSEIKVKNLDDYRWIKGSDGIYRLQEVDSTPPKKGTPEWGKWLIEQVQIMVRFYYFQRLKDEQEKEIRNQQDPVKSTSLQHDFFNEKKQVHGWIPEKGYIGSMFLKHIGIGRSSLQRWEQRKKENGGLAQSKKKRRNRQDFYPVDWIIERINESYCKEKK